ncbi:MAG: YkgJ family cysteine cluster protein [Desulfotomaculales bacterium]
MFNDLFREYEQLAAVADKAFQRMEREYGDKVKCEIHCTDCCHAVFGLFLIESVYLKYCFDKLDEDQKRAALLRADQADEDLARLQEKLEMYRDDPHLQAYALARQRIRCPLLDDQQNCILYPYRPITCRVYGIPTVINGKARVCWKAGFEAGESYPTFNLDAVYGHLYRLSQELLEKAGQTDMERATFLASVSKSIKTPVEDLVSEKLG